MSFIIHLKYLFINMAVIIHRIKSQIQSVLKKKNLKPKPCVLQRFMNV